MQRHKHQRRTLKKQVCVCHYRDASVRADGKGKLVEVLHCFGDLLWASHPDKPVPNPGFTMEMIFPADEVTVAAGAASEQPLADPCDAAVAVSADSRCEDLTDADEVEGPIETSATSDMNCEASQSDAIKPAMTSSIAPQSPEDMDALLQKCLLQALHKHVKDTDLPMAAGDLWQHQMLPNRYGAQADAETLLDRCID